MITNATTFPYELSIHAAWILIRGLQSYVEDIPKRHADGELPSYCCLLIHTAGKEVKKLIEWCKDIDAPYLGIQKAMSLMGPSMVAELNALARQIESLREKFSKLEEEELAKLRAKHGN